MLKMHNFIEQTITPFILDFWFKVPTVQCKVTDNGIILIPSILVILRNIFNVSSIPEYEIYSNFKSSSQIKETCLCVDNSFLLFFWIL